MSQSQYTMTDRELQSSRLSEAKRANLVLAGVLDRAGERGADYVRGCATLATVRWCAECGSQHIVGSWCCHHRLCPICQVRRSRRVAASAIDAFNHMRSTGQLDGHDVFLLTLTQRNVGDGALSPEINRLLFAMTMLRHTRDWRNYVAGAGRSLEITRNIAARSWHPHVHFILILKRGNPGMDTVGYWKSLWAGLLGLDYVPEIDIRPVVDDDAIYEISKYVAKSTELLMQLPPDELDAAIMELNEAVKKRNLIAYTGIWRRARRELKILDDDFVDQDESFDENCRCGGQFMEALMEWQGNEYVDVFAHMPRP